MKPFSDCFSKEAIVSYLCKLRVKVAKTRNKKHLIHLLTDSDKYNYHVNDVTGYTEYEKRFLEQLSGLFPSRKKWIKPGKNLRVNKKLNQLIPTFDKNYFALIKTIKKFRKKNPNELFLKNLDSFILDVQNSICDSEYRIRKPSIYPKLKDDAIRKGKNKCRPISLFELKDRVILSLTNKFLTRVFDKYFEDSSYAFRFKKNREGTRILSHHDCIKDINSFRLEKANERLWVVECDMEKFYDSVSHSIVKEFFLSLVEKVKNEYPQLDFRQPISIFNEFLNCYSFNQNVLPLNSNSSYWREHKVYGEFTWVSEQFEKQGYYRNLSDERIGVPQGGALSGLIANIVLDFADKVMLKTNAFYIRFCDDMIIVSPIEAECEKAKKLYVDALRYLKLVPHEFDPCLTDSKKLTKRNTRPISFAPFWDRKSKGPFKWGGLNEGGYPWIGFVGYELHFEGDTRIRKKSLNKELLKQKKIVRRVLNAIKSNRRRSLGSVRESVIHRLVGMSVGRVSLRNYKTILNEMCWKSGFKEISMNKNSISQMKRLDRNRNMLYYKMENELEKIRLLDNDKIEVISRKRQIVHFNKPFSYYYQILERHP